MNKLFTALAILALSAPSAMAAGFLTITVDGTIVKNGDVIVSNKVEVDGEDGDLWSWEIKPEFTIESSEKASYSLTISNKGETAFSYCGVSGATSNSLGCQTLGKDQSWTDNGELQAGRRYKVAYDYQHVDLDNIPDKVECYGHFVVEANAASGTENLEFDVNMIYDGQGAVNDITDERFTIVVGNGRVEAANGAKVEVYSLTGARVANEGLNGIYVARIGNKSIKIVVR